MLIGGIQPLTLLDYPQKIASIVFTAGCNLKCGYCHNPQFVAPKKLKTLYKHLIPEEKFFNFLKQRQNFINGVVISGGEPCIQTDLIKFIYKIKEYNLLVKLDTNGTRPKVLADILNKNIIDYCALDIKTSATKYDALTSKNKAFSLVRQSLHLLINSQLQDYECRTTVIKGLHNQDDIKQIAQLCANVPKYIIQNFRNNTVLKEKFTGYASFTDSELETFKQIANKYISHVAII